MILEKIECLDEYKLSMKSIYGHTDLSLSQKKYLTENDPYQKNDQEIVFYKINITGSEKCDQLVANVTENCVLATRMFRPVAVRQLTFSALNWYLRN